MTGFSTHQAQSLLPLNLRESAPGGWHSYREHCDELLGLYYDDGTAMQSLAALLRRVYPNNAEAMLRAPLTMNWLGQTINRQAMMYKSPPARHLRHETTHRLPDEEVRSVAARDFLNALGLNRAMKQANRFFHLLNACVLWVKPDFANKDLRLCVLAPHQVMVEPAAGQATNLRDLQAVYLPYGGNPDPLGLSSQTMCWLKYERRDEGIVPSLVDEQGYPVMGGLGEAEERFLLQHPPLSRFPLAVVRKYDPVDGHFFPDVPHSHLLFARWLNHELTRGALNTQRADFPSYSYNGNADELGSSVPATGAGVIVPLGDEGKRLEPIPVDAREKERADNVLHHVRLKAMMDRISLSSVDPSRQIQSGTSKFYDRQPEVEARQDELDTWKNLEEQELWPVLCEAAQMVDYPQAEQWAGLSLSVSFPELDLPVPPLEKRQKQELEIRMGLTTADAIRDEEGLQ